MRQYLALLRHVRHHGVDRDDRTGTGTRSVFGWQLRFDLTQGFPLVTTKRLYVSAIIHELLWFLRGDTNVRALQENGVHIWDEWAVDTGELGPIYGKQWRAWETADGRVIDQLGQVLQQIRTRPHSRRLLVSAWNPADLPDETLPPQENVRRGRMALAPCHTVFQFYVAKGRLSCQLYQRSADIFLGLPFNIASYALLTHLVAQVCGLQAGEFIHTLGDVHLYHNHFEQADTQLGREPLPLPRLVLNPQVQDLFAFRAGDIRIEGYQSHPPIRAPIAV